MVAKNEELVIFSNYEKPLWCYLTLELIMLWVDVYYPIDCSG
jgi:hypothetical protein